MAKNIGRSNAVWGEIKTKNKIMEIKFRAVP